MASAGDAQLQGSTPAASSNNGAPTPTAMAATTVVVMAVATTSAVRAACAPANAVATCVEINHWFGGSPPNFRTLYLDQIEVDSADFWTNRLLSLSSGSTAKELASERLILVQ